MFFAEYAVRLSLFLYIRCDLTFHSTPTQSLVSYENLGHLSFFSRLDGIFYLKLIVEKK